MTAVRSEDVGAVRILTLNRPDRRNALDLDDRVDLLRALEAAMSESRAIVLTGSGTTFCAGGDLQSMTSDATTARRRLDVVNQIVRLLARGPRPVVAAVEGAAFGLGLGLSCGSDVVICGRSASFSTAFGRVGLGPDTGISATLPGRVGAHRARELILSSRVLGAEEALNLGLVDELCHDGGSLERALSVAAQLATRSSPMVAGVKALPMNAGVDLDTALAAETDLQIELLGTVEFQEGRDAFFERRRPNFVID